MSKSIEKMISHLKNQGFVFQGSEIYGGLANSWDYGPLGCEVKNKLKKVWWDFFVKKNPLNVGLDSSIILNSKVWKASGHIDGFNDPLIDCKNCKSRWRADKLIEEFDSSINTGIMTSAQLEDYIKQNNILCKKCQKKDFTQIRKFALMFKTNQGVLEDDSSIVYLRPETAQGIFINFKNVQRSMRKKLPFGIGQIGKSFRNEITPGNFIFRTREFEQMELEFFFDPNDQKDWFKYWLDQIELFLTKKICLDKSNYKIRENLKDELAHYALKTSDIEFNFPFGWGELWGISHRSDFDLKVHQNLSKEDLTVLKEETNQKVLANVIEPSVGVERLMLAIFWQAYTEEQLEENNSRTVLKLPYNLAPYQVAITPLSKQLNQNANQLFLDLLNDFDAVYDETGNIGKRYRRQDAIGTPFVITYDFQTLEDQKVTIRYRDTMKQERILISQLKDFLNSQFN
ncbi:glycine--tRNA ligase [Mycoplasma mycoides]|uniref:glycine--tRNA ligase n=1 Tax=Mycoplasma mycoides TaxID=2102 RepID=UPI0003463346|nr:glycine--tRNA ligase [Mycoplasma mycoides]EXU60483.1 Glycyl-tRNA synthetase [Mycoplasma mycoides subsp. capri PG3]QVJ95853.1 glycine--tRNA ligase [Mycoplasma mycoides subsp. capri]QVK04070.1 glycine--tRNA ligase [Mycoplasma mycoides subsp. capri]QVK06370.1 glycine--tRNA ligase [Mycoplasma mycoides subsp. capri]QVK08896.1 glycine--tRNA ligase [Mycoplasma mycoides subsp. capri]